MRPTRFPLFALALALAACSNQSSSSSIAPVVYTVGGTVTGLGSGQLVLELNDLEQITLTQDGPFQFTTTWTGGSPYAIEVLEVPNEMIAVIEGQTGLITGPMDLSVSVEPAIQTYSVGGVLSGLNGNSLVLANNGEQLTLTADGPFVFPTEQEENTPYAVTIVSAPPNCAFELENASGMVVDADVTDVAARRAWTDSMLSDSIDGGFGSARNPQLAMSDNGDVVVAYEVDGCVFMSERRSGMWTHPTGPGDRLNPVGTEYPWDLTVAMGPTGDTIVAYAAWNGDDDLVYFHHYRAGAWTHPVDDTDSITPAGLTHNYMISPALDAAGNAIIALTAYQNVSPWGTYLFVSEFRSGVWTHPFDANDTFVPGDEIWTSCAAASTGGDMIVSWANNDGVYFREYRAGAWSAVPTITDTIDVTGNWDYAPAIAMDASGAAVMVWMEYGDNDDLLFASEYRAGTWTHPALEADAITPPGIDADLDDQPIAMDAFGDVLIAYEGWHGLSGTEGVFLSEYRGGTWTHAVDETDAISPAGSRVSDIAVAVNDWGDAYVVWESTSTPYDLAFRSEYRNGTWTHPVDLDDFVSPDDPHAGDVDDTFVQATAEGAVMVYEIRDESTGDRRILLHTRFLSCF